MFDFNISTTPATSSSKRRLAPWGIYPVKFNGCEIVEFDGKKDPTQHYKTLRVSFEGEDGYFSETIFFFLKIL